MASSPDQRFTMAIILATLTLCAFFLAQGATRVLAAQLFGDEVEPAPRRAPRRIGGQPDFLRRRDPAVILKRNIFDSSRGDLTLEPVAEVDGPTAGATEWDPSQPAPDCSMPLKLVGAVVNPTDPDWSYAAISTPDDKTMLYRRGSVVDGSQVLAVRSSSVVVQSGAGACELSMFAEETEEKPKLQVAKATKKAVSKLRSDRNAGLTAEELEEGIQKISDTRFLIDRSLVDKVLANQGSIMKAARVIPHEENGRIVGMKLYGIRRTSLLGKLGIRNGDMLRTINGFDMTSPDTALEAYSRLRTADQLSLAVKRQNKEMSIQYTVQ